MYLHKYVGALQFLIFQRWYVKTRGSHAKIFWILVLTECARLISAQNTVTALAFLGGFQGTDGLTLCINL